jgi:hypothetical protein
MCSSLKKLKNRTGKAGGNSLVISRVNKLKMLINWMKNFSWKGDAV